MHQVRLGNNMKIPTHLVNYEDGPVNPFYEYSDDCFFDGDWSEQHSHEEGVCVYCDWERMVSKVKGWDDPNFIEWWDYKEYWEGLNK